jgi:hypothetical protein
VATKPSASPLPCSRCGTAMKDVVTIAPLAGRPRTDRVRVPGLWASHERIGPAEPALRRLSCSALPVKTLEFPKLLERWSVSPLRGL